MTNKPAWASIEKTLDECETFLCHARAECHPKSPRYFIIQELLEKILLSKQEVNAMNGEGQESQDWVKHGTPIIGKPIGVSVDEHGNYVPGDNDPRADKSVPPPDQREELEDMADAAMREIHYRANLPTSAETKSIILRALHRSAGLKAEVDIGKLAEDIVKRLNEPVNPESHTLEDDLNMIEDIIIRHLQRQK